MAAVVARGEQGRFYTDASAFSAALAPLTRGGSSAEIFRRARIAALALFWLNIGLIAWCAGGSAAAWLGAATLAPVWDYGLEIRHDNVLLCGLLAIWLLRRSKTASSFAAGMIAAVLQFAVFKSFVYWVPLSSALLWKGDSKKRLAWVAGFVAALTAARLAYGRLGLWEVYLADFRSYLSYTAATERFLPPLVRLVWQTPLLLALLAMALREAWRKKSLPPEGALCLGALVLLFVNPTPYPYNLLNFVPFAFLFAFRHMEKIPRRLAWAAVVFGHLLPFCAATARHARWTNDRQVRVMELAEKIARPDEPVYDAIGLVPSRPLAGEHWYLQSLVRDKFLDGTWPPVRELLAQSRPPVFIASYRTDWLSGQDWAYIEGHYSPLADDFWVRKDRAAGEKIEPGDRRALFVNWY